MRESAGLACDDHCDHALVSSILPLPSQVPLQYFIQAVRCRGQRNRWFGPKLFGASSSDMHKVKRRRTARKTKTLMMTSNGSSFLAWLTLTRKQCNERESVATIRRPYHTYCRCRCVGFQAVQVRLDDKSAFNLPYRRTQPLIATHLQAEYQPIKDEGKPCGETG